MAAIVAVVAAIVSAVASVITTIVSIIATLIASIASVIATILSAIGVAIGSVLTWIGTYIFKGLTLLFKGIASLSVKVFSFVVKGFASFLQTIMSAAQALYQGIKTVIGTIGSIIKSIYGSIKPIITSILGKIKIVFDSIIKPIKYIIGNFREIYSMIKSSIIGKIVSGIKDVVDFVSTLFTIAQAYAAFDDKKYLKGIYILAMKFDQDLADKIKETKTYIDSNLMSLVRDIDSTFQIFRRDLTGLMQYSTYLEDVLKVIGKAFGVKELERIAEGIEDFKEDVLLKAKRFVETTQKEVKEWISDQLHPVLSLIRELNMTEREYKRYERIFNFLALKHLRPSMLGYEPSRRILIPRLVR